MAWGIKSRGIKSRGLAAAALAALALSGGASAQESLGDLHATGSGLLQTLYTDTFGNLDSTAGHSLGFGGRGTITGDYYNPDFLSFSFLPYYGRSQDNSDTQSITDSSGYNGTLNIFKGSHFPGVVNFQQNWNQTGDFGIPGVAGLTTLNNSHTFGIGWSALLPGKPSLSVGFGDTGGNSQLLGSPETTDSSNRNFNVASTYSLNRYFMSAGFVHLNDNVGIGGLESGETETANGASNQYRFMVQGPVPYRQSSMSLNLTRSSFSNDDLQSGTGSSMTESTNGTTDTVNGTVSLMFPKAPVSVTTIYTDNLLGGIEQQLISNGQVPLVGLNSPELRSLSVNATSYVNVLPRLMVGGYVQHVEQFYGREDFGLTQVGVTANYSFAHMLKGLTFYGGLTDNASQQGNGWLGFVGNVTYGRRIEKWQFNSFFLYNQNTQTLLAIYTTSTLNYGGSIKRQISDGLSWVNVANIIKSGFTQVAGNSSQGESFTSMLASRRFSIAGIYTKSDGTAILTSGGLVNPTVPSQLLPPGSTMLFDGRNYGVTVDTRPIRRLVINGSWSKALANTSSPLLASNSGNTNYYGFAGYEYRKLLFQAGVTKFTQSISNSGAPPTKYTSYSFGVQRWFKAF